MSERDKRIGRAAAHTALLARQQGRDEMAARIAELEAEVERLREIADDARDGQNVLQARIGRALGLTIELAEVYPAESGIGMAAAAAIRAALTGEGE